MTVKADLATAHRAVYLGLHRRSELQLARHGVAGAFENRSDCPMRNLPVLRFFAVCIAIVSSTSVFADERGTAKSEPSVTLCKVFKDDFLVGTAVNRSITTGRGFRRSAEEVRADIELVKNQFNQVVAENDMKWQLIHPRPGPEGYDFEAADALIEFAARNKMSVAGHTLVWHSQTPNWVFEGTHRPAGTGDETPAAPANPETSNPGAPGNGGQPGFGRAGGFGRFRPFDLNGPRASREELLQRMKEHIYTVVGRYKGKVNVWDVVNEAIADRGDEVLRKSPWSVIIGPDFIAKAFEYAHEADPDAVLRYNDYGLENPEKRRRLIALIKSLQEHKVPVMAIGSQAHCNVSISYETMDDALTDMETLGLPIHITELDINSAVGGQRGFGADINANAQTTEGGLVAEADKQLANAYAGLFKAFVKHRDAIDIVTFWGPNDALSWRSRGRPLLFDGSSQPKPAFDAVIQAAQRR